LLIWFIWFLSVLFMEQMTALTLVIDLHRYNLFICIQFERGKVYTFIFKFNSVIPYWDFQTFFDAKYWSIQALSNPKTINATWFPGALTNLFILITPML